jgi:multidrug efflux system membrane fusion protein
VNAKRTVVLIASLLALAACSEGTKKKKAEAPPVPVTTAKAVERDIPVTLRVVGRAEAYESVVLKSRVDGQVAAVLFTEGQQVKQGEALIRLDPTDFAARLQQAQATAARDQALIDKSRADTARYTALKERNFVSEEKVNDIRTNEAAASANLRASSATAEVARLQLSYATIRAPFDGVVGARLVFPGSSIKTNETVLAVVNRVRPLLVSFSIPEKHLPRLRAAMAAATGGNLTVEISLPGEPSPHYDGKVLFLDNAVDPTTGTILAKAVLPNSENKLTPGQFLNVSLLLETLKQAVSVPNEAVQQGATGNFVYVVKDDHSTEVRPIKTAAVDSGMTAIVDGLQPGETVVTDGQLRLAPGIKVREAPPAGSAANKPAAQSGPAATKAAQ